MRTRTAAPAALAATLLLLAACGTERTETASSSSAAPVDDPGRDGVRVISLTVPSPSASPSPSRSYSVSADRLATGADSGVSAGYEVTNESAEALTYSVVLTFASEDGGAVANQEVTVRDVGPGKTVRGTVHAGELPPSAPRITRARVLKVTKVPAGEAPADPGACPASGVRVSADRGDAAMGLRVVGLHLDNCGTRDYTVKGYPQLELLDENFRPVNGVDVLDGSGGITTGAGPDEAPGTVALAPGESATAALVWRNTTESGTPVNVPHVRVRARTGADPVTVTPELDLGTTGKLGVRPWKKADSQGRPAAGPS
ncbi:DUF4232 domain-containing protein [Streptomyces olivaceus]|uniref:DUF4232 domain-containing protein n=1 Tax=Streptomyces olivaceus TaxID=47716 RepID=UPI001CC9E3A9|nr:DUF4232 domain-containing protein [Streptomyces olivaceus]MBZ6208769.1 DUF4232 domain-containing protein [Streptomyces olivaceus]MBZ6292945.1 DUF4232 domain-containing protein [Streptomyces olivaceus]MBZ6327537.1 DUF4232 domain-containing protein [Streptomyces olivaceus]